MTLDSVRGSTLLMSGGSRGIGFEIAAALAARGVNVVLLAKTDTPHPRLPGTIHTAVAQIRDAGGAAVAVVGDVRDADDVERAVAAAVETFGGIDIVVNNASAIDLASSLELAPKAFSLMQEVNIGGTWKLTATALPHLLASRRPRIVTLSPPLNLSPRWLGVHPGYTVSKYGMTLLTQGWAAEFADRGMGAFALWPETLIDTSAVRNIVGGIERARSPRIMADAAVELLSRPASGVNGGAFIDADVLREAGVGLDRYGGGPTPARDIFVD